MIVKKPYKWIKRFDEKKNIEDSMKKELIITATITEIFIVLKAENVMPPKASLDMEYMEKY